MLANGSKIVTIVGPTCTGKSELAMNMAQEFNGEIINADSMQVFKHFNIGTAKQANESQRIVPHHLIDIMEPYEEFNAAIFMNMADRAIFEIWTRGKIPIVVGGTGLYIRALIYGLFKVQSDKKLRKKLEEEYDNNPLSFYDKVKKVDPEYGLKISFRDKRRMVRAMEVFQITGLSMSAWSKTHGFRVPRYRVLKIGLTKPRYELFRRIDRRVEEMLENGWVEEVRGILAMGFDERLKPFTSIGYREILQYVHDSITYDDMVKDIKKFTRHYAKRQFTWFRSEKDIIWYAYPEEYNKIKKRVIDFLA